MLDKARRLRDRFRRHHEGRAAATAGDSPGQSRPPSARDGEERTGPQPADSIPANDAAAATATTTVASSSSQPVPDASGSQNRPSSAAVAIATPCSDDESPQGAPSDGEQNEPGDNGSEQSRPLWDRAYDRLRKEQPLVVAEYERILAEAVAKKTIKDNTENEELHETMRHVVNKQLAIVTNRQWRLRTSFRHDESVPVVEVVDKIVKIVLKAKDVGSGVASLDPLHAGIPFAAVCFMLPILTNASEERAAALNGLELIADLVDLYADVESSYLRDRHGHLSKKLASKLENLYVAILSFLARASCSLDQPTANRLFRDTLKREHWGRALEEIREADLSCREFARRVHEQEQRQGMLSMTDLIAKHEESIQELLRQFRARLSENQDILRWVSDVDVDSAHGLVRAKLGLRYQNSGQWFRDRCRTWRESSEYPTFWLCGSVGTGKSCLISHVIEWHMAEINPADDERLAYFYCSGRDGQTTDATVVVRSLIAQLALPQDGCELDARVREIQRSKRHDSLSPELLAAVASRYARTTIVIDALDECRDYSKLLSCLLSASRAMKSGKLRFFFSSRPDVRLLPSFPRWEKLELDADESLTAEDMRHYIYSQVKSPDGSALLNGKEPELENRLIDILSRYAQGMFRWVELQLARFLSDHSGLDNSEDVVAQLDKLEHNPGDRTLDKAYDEIYDMNTKAGTKSRLIASRALKWVLCSSRVLELHELAEVAAVGESSTMKEQTTGDYILKICSNFIVAKNTPYRTKYGFTQPDVSLAHLSVREYLARRTAGVSREYSEEEANSELARACLTYLVDPALAQSPLVSTLRSMQEYSVFFWADHWHKAGEERYSGDLGKVYQEFRSSVAPGSPFYFAATWQSRCRSSLDAAVERWTIGGNLLWATFIWGLEEIANECWDGSTTEMGGVEVLGDIAVEYACQYDQPGILKILLKQKLEPTPTHWTWALEMWKPKVLRELLLHTAWDPPVKEVDRCGRTAITLAAKQGDHELVNLLLDRGADLSIRTTICHYDRHESRCFGSPVPYAGEDERVTALHEAARAGQFETV